MSEFGRRLREWREGRGLTQEQFAESLGYAVSRPTIATMESGRSTPSPTFWSAFANRYPEAETPLGSAYAAAREEQAKDAVSRRQRNRSTRKRAAEVPDRLLGGPFIIERLEIIYVFRESRAPEEILEVRQVRATAQVRDYALKLEHLGSPAFKLDTEVLWGGVLAAEQRRAVQKTIYLRRLDLGRTLKRGDRHTFGIRYFVERDVAQATTSFPR